MAGVVAITLPSSCYPQVVIVVRVLQYEIEFAFGIAYLAFTVRIIFMFRSSGDLGLDRLFIFAPQRNMARTLFTHHAALLRRNVSINSCPCDRDSHFAYANILRVCGRVMSSMSAIVISP
jgi:hypothetical protein